MKTQSFHRSNFGSFDGGLNADRAGYVHLTIAAVLAGDWDTAGGRMTRDQAREIANSNRVALAAADQALANWRAEN